MNIKLYTTEEHITYYKKGLSFEEFKKLLLEYKPKNIINMPYSAKKPCWVITEYLDNDRIKYFANGWADKTPVEASFEDIHSSWLIQGLNHCHFTKD